MTTLFVRLGGLDGLTRIVEAHYARVLADDHLGEYFMGVDMDRLELFPFALAHRKTLAHCFGEHLHPLGQAIRTGSALKAAQVAFLRKTFGDPESVYTGASMQAAHKGQLVSELAFDAFIDSFVEVAAEQGVDASTQAEARVALKSMRAAVITEFKPNPRVQLSIEINLKRSLPMLKALVLTACLLTGFQAVAADKGCEPGFLSAKYPTVAGKTIRIAQDGESPPYAYRDPADFEHLIGLDADFARAAFACIGAKIEFKTGKWSGMLPSVIAGQADLMWDTLYYTPARAKQVDFVTVLLAATGGMVRKGNPKNIHGLDDICGLRAEAGLGTVEEARFRQVSETCVAGGKPAVEVLTYQDQPSGMRMLQTNRADVMMTDSGSVGQAVAMTPNDFERAFTVKTDFKVGPAFSKTYPALRDAVFEAIRLLQADGTQGALMEKYHIDASLQLPAEMFTQ